MDGWFWLRFAGGRAGIHFLPALEAVYKRKALRMSASDMVQFLTEMAIVPLVVPHVIGIGAMREIMSDAGCGVGGFLPD